MKNLTALLIMLCLLVILPSSYGQVGINNDGSAPDASSQLDIKSTDKGLLIPRMTEAERDAIINPAIGLILFNTTNNSINFYAGTGWRILGGTDCLLPDLPGAIQGTDTVCQGATGVAYSIEPCYGASSYVWSCYNGAVLMSGQGTTSVTVDFTNNYSTGILSVKAINGCGESNPVNLYVAMLDTLSLLTHPEDMATYNYGFAMFSVTASGDCAFQWQESSGGEFTDLLENSTYRGVHTATLVIWGVNPDIEGYQYRCVLSSPCPASIISNAATLTNVDTYECGFFTTTIEDLEGNSYHTVLIGNKCWMSENINIGTRIDNTGDMQDNGEIEKYCYNDLESNCDIYGGLYQWNEMMLYETTEGVTGICPVGWHIPTDDEWKNLEGWHEQPFSPGAAMWNGDDTWRGIEAGKNMKSMSGWLANTGVDWFGFEALPGGYIDNWYSFSGLTTYGYWWTSTSNWSGAGGRYRALFYSFDDVYRSTINTNNAISVRCIRD